MSKSQLKPLAEQIRVAREAKALSQRVLAEQVGIPQSHISRIENGSVDLQVSSLIQIARALDLEFVLIPRSALPAVSALRKQPPVEETRDAARNRSQLNSLRVQVTRLARRFPKMATLKRLLQTILELREFPLELPAEKNNQLRVTTEEIGRFLRELDSSPPSKDPARAAVRKAESLEGDLRNIRNAIIHGQAALQVTQTPAYTLDDDGNDDG